LALKRLTAVQNSRLLFMFGILGSFSRFVYRRE